MKWIYNCSFDKQVLEDIHLGAKERNGGGCWPPGPNLWASAYSEMWVCSVLVNINMNAALYEQWIVHEIKYGPLTEFLVLFFLRLVQGPSECCREKPEILVIGFRLWKWDQNTGFFF